MIFKKTEIYGCKERPGDVDHASPYMTRYTLIERKNWQVCLHIFHRSDARIFHDHPWNFVTAILWRGYIEETPGLVSTNKRRVWPGMVLFLPANHAHRVELVNEKPAVTLVFMGRRVRLWGFFEYVSATKLRWLSHIDYGNKYNC